MDDIQALNGLYNAARLAPLNASEHELAKKCAEQLLEALKPKPDSKVEEFPKTS
jgi:hypothetical protein